MIEISIHALLAESDEASEPIGTLRTDFYPRSPCGERLLEQFADPEKVAISIHALLAESDWHIHGFLHGLPISIHALLAESDKLKKCCFRRSQDFYPRSPCGERRF